MKKLFSLAMVMIMALALCVPAFAQDVNSNQGGSATITISNAAKGETYSIYKLFDATVTGTKDGSIAYTGNIPKALADYFEKDSVGNISATDDAKDGDKASDELQEALAAWAETETATATAVSDGSTLVFTGLGYGYYVIITTQKTEQADGTFKSVITVNSTNPNATVHDKNVTEPTLEKSVDDDDVNIGDTVTYTVTFKTSNYDGAGEAAKQIVSYTIEDTLPEFLSNVTVTKITIGGEVYKVNGAVPQFNDDKEITIPWVDANNTSLYKNGSTVSITYTAIVNGDAAIGSANINKATLTWSDKSLTDDAEFYTYAFDVVKTDSDKKVLNGAKFELYDAQTNGNKIALIVDDGVYRVATEAEQSVEGFKSAVIEAGKATITGLSSGTYYLEETKAPDGYNMLTDRVEVKIEKAVNSATVTDGVYQNGGVQVINLTGALLPSTGGMGTTIFYTVGGILMAGAAILLITKKKMANEQ